MLIIPGKGCKIRTLKRMEKWDINFKMVPPFFPKCRASVQWKKWQHHCQSSCGRRKRWLTLCGMQYILSQELTTQYNQARDDISVSQCMTVNTSMGGGRTHKTHPTQKHA